MSNQARGHRMFFKSYFLFLQAQQWKMTTEMKLENGNGSWIFSDKVWIIPNQGTEGFIEDQNSPGNVLGLIENSQNQSILTVDVETEVVLGAKLNPISNKQRWFAGI